MKAQVGDWMVVESLHVGEPRRIGQIRSVEHQDGSPPYRVRWTENDRETLFFPGPEAHVEKFEALNRSSR
ncbi:MAG TPA: DUF1918 domain-containing protein [Yinghuangia sp.]|uniref:DUF1918 domain-containing protein n=1 Tax=Yinghuangia sp. YIM S10712 TaxID=3436930 RepID=UPI002B807A45|nr:DUF1918 domain-containing protein [Yinghuangia sp.]